MKKIFVLLAVVMLFCACGLTKEKLGMKRSTPDDGYKARKERLVVPPDYDVRPVEEKVEATTTAE